LQERRVNNLIVSQSCIDAVDHVLRIDRWRVPTLAREVELSLTEIFVGL
jgi:hypothetical protein